MMKKAGASRPFLLALAGQQMKLSPVSILVAPNLLKKNAC
jgi:hypothetical protein